MKPKRSFEPHLALTKTILQPGTEWQFSPSGWSLLLVDSGVAYWLNPRVNHELTTGSVLLLSERASGMIRASQVASVTLHHSRLNSDRLNGLLTWGEQEAIERAATQEPFSVRLFAAKSPLAEKLREVCELPDGTSLTVRLKLLDVFVEALGTKLWETQPDSTSSSDATMRLIKLLNETPASALLELSFRDLVHQVRCTPRHLSRIFREVVGMSFREKQAQLRLVRAQELLATTQSKVVEVALESGYQSLSLFNLMFKRRFGLTPAKWRSQTNLDNNTPRRKLRLRL